MPSRRDFVERCCRETTAGFRNIIKVAKPHLGRHLNCVTELKPIVNLGVHARHVRKPKVPGRMKRNGAGLEQTSRGTLQDIVARRMEAERQITRDRQSEPNPFEQTTDFSTLPGMQELKVQRSAADLIGLANPFFRVHETRAGATTQIDGRLFTNFSSYDYLGLNGHPRVQAAAREAIEQFGTSCSASRLVAGGATVPSRARTRARRPLPPGGCRRLRQRPRDERHGDRRAARAARPRHPRFARAQQHRLGRKPLRRGAAAHSSTTIARRSIASCRRVALNTSAS